MIPVEEKSKPQKIAPTPEQRRQRQLLLRQLVYEMDDKPIYYAGYRDVLKGLLEPEAIMGASYLQSYLVEILQEFLFTHTLHDEISKQELEMDLCLTNSNNVLANQPVSQQTYRIFAASLIPYERTS